MATAEASLLGFLGNDAEFRSWGKGVSDMLAAAGLTRASDSGQINWASVARPGVVNTAAGFEMWRFSDALQASAPGFVKIEYGVAGAVDRPSLWVTVGTGSNGAGTLTAQVGVRTQAAPTVSVTSGTLRPWFVSAGPDRVAVAGNLNTSQGTQSMFFTAERTRDGAGAATGDGVLTIRLPGTGNPAIQVVPAAGAVPSATNYTPWVDIRASGVTSAGGNVALAPALCAVGRLLFGITALACNAADLPGGAPVTVSILGAERTYMPLTAFAVSSPAGMNFSSGNGALALLWE